MTRKKKIAAWILGVLVLLVIVLVLVIAFFDWNRLKPTINEKVSDAIGRPFAINGDLSVHWQWDEEDQGWRHWVPWPHVSAENIVVANTEWGKAPNFATLQRAQFSLSPLPLLNHRVVIRDIQLTKPAADLQRLQDGRANWVFVMKESGEPSPWAIDISQVGFDEGRIGYADAPLKADLEVKVNPLGKPIPYAEIAGANPGAPKVGEDAPTPTASTYTRGGKAAKGDAATADAPAARKSGDPGDYVFGWTVQGKYNAQALKGEGKIGGRLSLDAPDRPFPLQADVAIGDTRATVAGTLTDPLHFGALDLRLKVAGSSMAKLYPLTGVTLPDTPPYATDGRLIAQIKREQGPIFEYRDFNGKLGQSDLHGSLTFTGGQPRPKLVGKVNSALLRLEDLGPLVGVQSGGAKAADGMKKQPSDKALPVDEFRTERWQAMDANIQVDAKRIVYGPKLPLTDLNAHLIMDAGKLDLDPLNFAMAGGTLAFNIALDGAKTPMQGRVKISARSLKLKQLFATTEAMQKSLGALNGDAALSGVGNSVAALLGTSNGQVKLLVNDGVISRSLMEIAGLNVGNYVVNKLFGDDEVKINCGAADVVMKDGVMTPNLFIFDTENAIVKIDGPTDFKKETLDLDIKPESKGFRIFSLRSPLYVRGTFKNPSAGVHVLPLAARGAGMVVLGAALTPVAGLLALIAPSAGTENNQCQALLTQLQRAPVKAPPAGRDGSGRKR
jgi:uncharacterized protein involved in outer membrane biogenesis